MHSRVPDREKLLTKYFWEKIHNFHFENDFYNTIVFDLQHIMINSYHSLLNTVTSIGMQRELFMAEYAQVSLFRLVLVPE